MLCSWAPVCEQCMIKLHYYLCFTQVLSADLNFIEPLGFVFCFCGVVSAFSIKPSPVWFCSLPFPICFSVLSGLHLLTSSLSEELLSLCVCCCCQSCDLHPSIIPLIRLRRLSDSQMKNEDFRAHIIFLIDWRNIWIIKCLWSSPKRFHLLTCDNCFLSCQFFVKILRESNFLFFFFSLFG